MKLAVPDGSSGPSRVLKSRLLPLFAGEETEFHSVKQLSSAHSQRVEEMGLDTRLDCLRLEATLGRRGRASRASSRAVRKHSCSIYAEYWKGLEIIWKSFCGA